MKGRFLITILLLFPYCLFAQLSVTELSNNLAHATNDSLKINAYKELIKHYRVENSDSDEFYGHQALQYAVQKKYHYGEAVILEQLANADKSKGRLDIAERRTNEALTLYRNLNYLPGVARMTNSLGAIEGTKGNYDVSIKLFIAALKLYDTVIDKEGQMITYLNFGTLLLNHNDSVGALKYLTLARQTGEKMPLKDATISVYNTLGILEVARGDSQGALQLFLKALKLSDKPEFIAAHVESISYLGRFYLDKGQIETALKYLNEGLTLAETHKMPALQADILLELGQIMTTLKPEEAMSYLKKAEAIYRSIQSRQFLVIVYDEMAALYIQQGNYRGALEATIQKQKVSDSVSNINLNLQVRALSSQYEFEQSSARMKELELLSKRNAMERNVFIVIAALIIVILVVLLFYYRRSTTLNKQLRLRKEELKVLNSMKNKLFSVIGHDLRGPLASIPAIIDIYEDESTGEDERKFILGNLKEHSKVSLETLDKLLYWGQSLVKGVSMRQSDFYTKGYITEAIEFKKMAAAEKNITVSDTTAADIRVHADPAHFDFIIRNLLANAIKYTYHNGHVSISASAGTKDGFIVFAVKDSGLGMDKKMLDLLFAPVTSVVGTANEKGNGIGLMLCKEFAVQNGGDIWVTSEPGKGSVFYFSVKKTA